VNGRPYEKIDPAKEWIILPGSLEGRQEILARYR